MTDSETKSRSVVSGARLGGATGILLLATVYSLLAPTADIRARIPFLLASGGGLLEPLVFVVLVLPGAAFLLATRRLNRHSAIGLTASAAAYVGLLSTGVIAHALPSFDATFERLVAMSLGLLLTFLALTLGGGRRGARQSRASQSEPTA